MIAVKGGDLFPLFWLGGAGSRPRPRGRGLRERSQPLWAAADGGGAPPLRRARAASVLAAL